MFLCGGKGKWKNGGVGERWNEEEEEEARVGVEADAAALLHRMEGL